MNRKTFLAYIAAFLAFITAPIRALTKTSPKTGEMKLFYRWNRQKECLEFQYWQDGKPVSAIMVGLDPAELHAPAGFELHEPDDIVWTSPITGERICPYGDLPNDFEVRYLSEQERQYQAANNLGPAQEPTICRKI